MGWAQAAAYKITSQTTTMNVSDQIIKSRLRDSGLRVWYNLLGPVLIAQHQGDPLGFCHKILELAGLPLAPCAFHTCTPAGSPGVHVINVKRSGETVENVVWLWNCSPWLVWWWVNDNLGRHIIILHFTLCTPKNIIFLQAKTVNMNLIKLITVKSSLKSRKNMPWNHIPGWPKIGNL